ncbi:MAG: endonuclease III [Eubacterium sp.]|jgi:endonuclease-3
MVKKKTAAEILDRLSEAYPDAGCALHFKNPFQLLVAVVLSAQTTDVSVNSVTPELFAKYPGPDELANAEQAEVASIIRKIGMYRTKSANIIALSRRLTDDFGGEVPGDFDSLVSLPGVGRKTANVVLAEAFGQQRIAVDTHVFRVSNRIGLAKAKTPEDTEEQLKRILPHDRYTEAHHLLIFHGRRCCSARKPNCDSCPINDLCEKDL